MHFEHGLYRHLESLFAQARSKAPDSLAAIRGLLENALKENDFLAHSVDVDRFSNGYNVFRSVLHKIPSDLPDTYPIADSPGYAFVIPAAFITKAANKILESRTEIDRLIDLACTVAKSDRLAKGLVGHIPELKGHLERFYYYNPTDQIITLYHSTQLRPAVSKNAIERAIFSGLDAHNPYVPLEDRLRLATLAAKDDMLRPALASPTMSRIVRLSVANYGRVDKEYIEGVMAYISAVQDHPELLNAAVAGVKNAIQLLRHESPNKFNHSLEALKPLRQSTPALATLELIPIDEPKGATRPSGIALPTGYSHDLAAS